MVLLRHLLGDVLRRLRLRQGRTLREVSAAARVSLGYLSEVERGQKEASSELLAAICTALNTPLSHVLGEVSDSFALAELQNESVLTPAGRAADGHAERDLDLPSSRPFRVVDGHQPLRLPARRHAGLDHAALEHAALDHAGLDHPGLDAEPVLGAVEVNAGHPAFDEVTRRVRDVTDMVPV